MVALTLMDIQVNIHKEFLYYTLVADKTQGVFKSISAGSGVKNLKKESNSSIQIAFPPLPEQKAIAKTLQTWDTAIETTEKFITEKEKQFTWLVDMLIRRRSKVWGHLKTENIFSIGI